MSDYPTADYLDMSLNSPDVAYPPTASSSSSYYDTVVNHIKGFSHNIWIIIIIVLVLVIIAFRIYHTYSKTVYPSTPIVAPAPIIAPVPAPIVAPAPVPISSTPGVSPSGGIVSPIAPTPAQERYRRERYQRK